MDGTAAPPPQEEWRTGPDLLESVWRYRWLVLAATVLAALVGFAASYLQPTLYEAEAEMLLSAPEEHNVFDDQQGGGAPDQERHVRNKAEAANSYAVAARASEMLDGQVTPEQIHEDLVEARPSVDVDVITVSARASSPDDAALLANTVSEAYQELASEDERENAEEAMKELQESKSDLQARIDRLENQMEENPDDSSLQAERDAAVSQLMTIEGRADQMAVDAALQGAGVEHFEEARPPESPAQPQPTRNAAVAGVLGLLASSALAWWRAEHTQSADRRQDAAPVLRAPLLGHVPDFKAAGVTTDDPARSAPHSAPAEAYQFVVSSLEYALAQNDGSSVIVTSAGKGDGKTVTALNLAVAAARDGRRVLLVDGDERMRGLTALCGSAPAPGLTDLVDDAVPFEGCIATLDVPGVASLPFLPAGTQPYDAAGFFRTPGFRKAMMRAKEHADLVIVDSPPALAVSDTSAIAGQVDGILTVVAQGTPLKVLEEVRERFEFIGTPLLGYVFNRADARGAFGGGYGYRYGYGYGYGYGNGDGKGSDNAPPAASSTPLEPVQVDDGEPPVPEGAPGVGYYGARPGQDGRVARAEPPNDRPAERTEAAEPPTDGPAERTEAAEFSRDRPEAAEPSHEPPAEHPDGPERSTSVFGSLRRRGGDGEGSGRR